MGFEAHAIVELMGHQRIAGKVSEETIAGAAMLRVDVPKTERREPYTKFYTAGAVYCITPTDEATATLAAQQFDQPPVSPYIVRMPESPLLAERIRPDHEWRLDDDEDRDFEDDDYEPSYDDEDEDDPALEDELNVGTQDGILDHKPGTEIPAVFTPEEINGGDDPARYF